MNYQHTPENGISLETPPLLKLDEVWQKFLIEADCRELDTGNYRCPYYVWGSGPPLIFIHGMADDSLSFLMPISQLAENFQCIAYDLPAGGKDKARLGRYRHSYYVEDLLALVDHLGLRSPFLFGSSFGSTIALQALHSFPDRFPRAVLQGGFAQRPLAPAEIIIAKLARYWPGRLKNLPFRKQILEHVHLDAFAAREPAIWNFYQERTCFPPIAAVARRALIISPLDLRHLLPQIRQPNLLVCGDHDPLVGKECEEILLENLPNAERILFENCGHLPYFTHPELLAEVVTRYLKPLPCERGN